MASSKLKKIIILFLNIILYLIYGNCIFPIIIASVFTFLCGKIINKNKNFYLVSIVFLSILFPLLFYKYIIGVFKINLVIPLGISYYTLALISYISDIYHNRYHPSENILDFLLYSLFFPCLFIGPINKYNDFVDKIKNIKYDRHNIFKALLRICLGLVKKFIIANKLSIVIMELSANTSYTGLYVLFGCLIYSVYLYCDFSGGIDIVLGVSKLFNIDLVENFNKPYLSESIKEFWRRWHISLGIWLKDYIYIPMGGNREGKIKTFINTVFTFFISGVWHGLNYILWGIINGILVVINFKTKNKYFNIMLTIISISLLWVFFIYNDTILSLKMFASIFKISSFNIENLGLNIIDYIIVFTFFITVLLYELYDNKIGDYLSKMSSYKKLLLILIIIFLVLLFGNYGLDVISSNFVYGSF